MRFMYAVSPPPEQKGEKWARKMAIGVLAALTIFDVLNALQLVSATIEFTHFGRIISTGGVLLGLFVLDRYFQKRWRVSLPSAAWMVGAMIVLVDFVGDVLRLYGRWEQYDQFAHLLSGPLLVGALILGLSVIARAEQWRVPNSVLILLALGLDAIIAVCYEIEEYLEDVFTLSHRLGDGPDTANDLMMNVLGGVLLVVGMVVYEKAKQKWYTFKSASVPVRVIHSH